MNKQLQLKFMFWVIRVLRTLLRREDGDLWKKLDELSEEIASHLEPEKDYVEFNTNSNVLVKLNPKGLKILDEYYKSIKGFAGTSTDGYYQFQAHELMSLFGNHMYPNPPPFEPNIRISKKSLH